MTVEISRENIECPFCRAHDRGEFYAENGAVFALEDQNPVTPGHIIIMPKRHAADFYSMTDQELADANTLIRLLSDRIRKSDKRVTGFNIGANCGASAGQTVMHAHIHLIPRRNGDAKNPRGGVRGVIPGKRDY